jgi:hypothetical protein
VKKKDRYKVLLMVGAGMVFGAGGGYAIGKMLKHTGSLDALSDQVLLLLPVAYLAMVLLHEIGHVVFGLACGFRFMFLVAGPICFQRKDERMTFRLNANPALWGPRAGCLPRTYGPELKRKMLWFTLGGPLFSVLGGLALWPGWMLRNSNPTLSGFLMSCGFLSAITALATLIPLNMVGSSSDGARVLMLLRNRPEGTRWVAMGAIAGLSTQVRPREWPEALVEMLGDGRDEAPDTAPACMLRYMFHVDRREWERAAEWNDRALGRVDAMAASLRSGIYYCSAWLEARYRQDAAKARHYFDEGAKVGYMKPKDVPSVAAAVLIAEGRRDEALAEIALAEKSLALKTPGVAASLQDDIVELRAAL